MRRMNMERSMFWCVSVAASGSLHVARQKRRQYMKRDVNTRNETLIHENGPTKETNTYLQTESWRKGRCVGCRGMGHVKRDTCIHGKRRMYAWKETLKKKYTYMKRNLQKRPIHTCTRNHGERDWCVSCRCPAVFWGAGSGASAPPRRSPRLHSAKTQHTGHYSLESRRGSLCTTPALLKKRKQQKKRTTK